MRYHLKTIGIALGTISLVFVAMLGGGWYSAYSNEQLEQQKREAGLAQIHVEGGLDLSCPSYAPVGVTVANNHTATMTFAQYSAVAYDEGHSSRFTFGLGSSDKIIEPGDEYRECFSVPYEIQYETRGFSQLRIEPTLTDAIFKD